MGTAELSLVSDTPLEVLGIVSYIETACGFTPGVLKAKYRGQQEHETRAVVAFWMRNRLGLSYPALGRMLNRDHSSQVTSVRRGERLSGTARGVWIVQTLDKALADDPGAFFRV